MAMTFRCGKDVDFFMTEHKLIGDLQMQDTWKLLIYNRNTAFENIVYKT